MFKYELTAETHVPPLWATHGMSSVSYMEKNVLHYIGIWLYSLRFSFVAELGHVLEGDGGGAGGRGQLPGGAAEGRGGIQVWPGVASHA